MIEMCNGLQRRIIRATYTPLTFVKCRLQSGEFSLDLCADKFLSSDHQFRFTKFCLKTQ